MDVAQPIWLSGCPAKGHFHAKSDENGFSDGHKQELVSDIFCNQGMYAF